MPFQIQITVDSIEEAERILACLKHDNAPAAQQVASQVSPNNPQVESAKINSAVEPPKKKRGRPRREVAPAPAPESAAPVASLSEKQDPAPAPESEVEVKGQAAQQTTYTFDDTKAALKKLLDKYEGDMKKPLEVLGQFGAERISAVKEADYAAFIAACERV